jgi:hypothetical protein
VQINPPFGYSEIVPLYKNQKVLVPAPGTLPEFCRKANAVPISFSEFAAACRDYPLAFIATNEGRGFTPVAVLGVAGGENLFVRDEKWDASVYLPAYVRRYPFCMARVAVNAVEQADRLICVEKAFVSEAGESMFGDSGAALPRWEPIEKLLREYETDLERSQEMCAILADYALLEPFSVQAAPKGGAAMTLSGMHRVDEKKLEFLNAAQHRNLIRKGIMGRLYAHLVSLENFARLLQRKNDAAAAGRSL